MSTEPETRDAAAWARPVERLTASDGHINVTGRGMWQKTYRTSLAGTTLTPQDVVATWKDRFPDFWPSGNRFFAPLSGIAPGEVAAIDLSMPGGLKLSTGVLVLYADDESFTLMTPQGHMFAGWITFSSYVEDGETYAQAQVLMRASDPLYEVGMTLGGHKKEDEHWMHTLRALALYLGAQGEVSKQAVCVDRKRQWSRAGNVWQNSGIRSGMHMTTAPIRLVARPFRRGS